MRFLVFNLVVIGALVYLVRGGDFWLLEALNQPASAPVEEVAADAPQATLEKASELPDQAKALLAAMTEQLAAAEARIESVTEELSDLRAAAVENVEDAPAKPVVPLAAEPKPLPPLDSATQIAPLPERKIDPALAQPLARDTRPVEEAQPTKQVVADVAPSAPSGLPADVAARRAEVLSEGRATASKAAAGIVLEDGSALMTPRDRLRALSELAEDLEVIYLEGPGS